ncbi:MAG: ThuA domain-containing protein [Acidobacteria bacterium]|nr:ThuA domain-containing protein [Acidobacteriota bacterium]
MAEPRILVVTKGHPFEREPFLAMFDAVAPDRWVHVEHPEAQQLFVEPRQLAEFDAIVFYDMPGIEFTGAEPPVRLLEPSDDYIEGFSTMLADSDGPGLVFLHHAVAGWPAWDRYPEIVGARFHYQPSKFDGRNYPDSGYRHDVTHTVDVIDRDHPVCAGLPAHFEITDEVYCFPVLEDRVHPLMRSRHRFESDGFYSSAAATRGRMYDSQDWTHPTGSDLSAWTQQVEATRVVTIQFGDGPQTYSHPVFRRLLTNAVAWV